MPYNYNYDIATSRTKVIARLLFRWRGSVWQAVYIELFIWWFLYMIVSIIYRLGLSPSQQVVFEKFCQFCDKRMSYIPLSFMLSFFVTIVVNRWMTQFGNLGMIDNIALFTSCFVKGSDERGRQLRRNIARYCVLSQALVFRDIHIGVRKRFPTLETLVSAGFMLPHELEKFENCKSRYAKYWMGFNWALHLLNIAKKEGRIDHAIDQNAIAMEIRQFRSGLSLVWTYDWVPLPIMYPQLIYLAVHTYFFVCLFSRQFIVKPEIGMSEIDLYFPFMSSLEFLFYVAMALLNPFGDDDEDFDCNFLLDRNLTLSLTCVDEAFDDVPDVQPDIFYNDTVCPLYSEDSAQKSVNFYVGSANKAELAEGVKEIHMVPHPVNEKLDRFIQRPARTRRTTVVSVKTNTSIPPIEEIERETRSPSFSSQIVNVLRHRRPTASSADLNTENFEKPRASTDVGNGGPNFLVPPAYRNPTFITVTDEADEAPPDEDQHVQHHLTTPNHMSGGVRDHINRHSRSFNAGTSREI